MHVKYFLPMIVLGIGGVSIAANNYESAVPSWNSSVTIKTSKVENKAGSSLVSRDLTKISPYDFPEMARRGAFK